MVGRLEGKNVLITHADRYMGPAIGALFAREGANVHADTSDLTTQAEVDSALTNAGAIDVLVANLSENLEPFNLAHEITDEQWDDALATLATPLMRVVRAVLPQMIERRAGKIVAVTSAAPLRGIPRAAAYCAARGAQNAFIRAVGLEVARHNIQVNAIAQNYVENPRYYPPEMLADEAMMARIMKVIPAKRLGKPEESAEFALFLASDKSDFFVGQIFPFSGGWTTTTG